jgi:hypothetical protein
MADEKTFIKVDGALETTTYEPVKHRWERAEIENFISMYTQERDTAIKNIAEMEKLLIECDKLGI